MVTLPFVGGMPTIFHVHAGEVSPIDEVSYVYSDKGNTASFEIDGFSAILVHEAGPKVYEVDFQVSDAPVGEYLDVRGSVTLLDEIEYEGNTLVVRDDHDKTIR